MEGGEAGSTIPYMLDQHLKISCNIIGLPNSNSAGWYMHFIYLNFFIFISI